MMNTTSWQYSSWPLVTGANSVKKQYNSSFKYTKAKILSFGKKDIKIEHKFIIYQISYVLTTLRKELF